MTTIATTSWVTSVRLTDVTNTTATSVNAMMANPTNPTTSAGIPRASRSPKASPDTKRRSCSIVNSVTMATANIGNRAVGPVDRDRMMRAYL